LHSAYCCFTGFSPVLEPHNKQLLQHMVRTVSLRTAIFLVMLAVSIPLAYPVGVLFLGLLPAFEVPPSGFWHIVDDYVLDLPVKWPFLTIAPVDLVMDMEPAPTSPFSWTMLSCVGWLPIAIAYSWLTRRWRLPYVLLGVYPTIWALGIGISLLVDATSGSSFDSSSLP
jgi:hypothetical protein